MDMKKTIKTGGLVIGILLGLIFSFPNLSFGQDVTDGLVGHWKFDEKSGAIAHDSSGEGHHGKLTDNDPANDDKNTPPKWSKDRAGNGILRFDGVDDCVDLGDIDKYEFGPDDKFTVSLWLKPGKPGRGKSEWWAHLVGRLNGAWFGGAGKWTWAIRQNASVGFNMGDGVNANGHGRNLGAIPHGAWHHFVVVVGAKGEKIECYRNGKKLEPMTRTIGQVNKTSNPFRIGGEIGANESRYWFKGEMDDIRIYNRALSQEEVVALNTQLRKPSTAYSQGLTSSINTPVSMNLKALDPNGEESLTYQIVTPPANGKLSGEAPNLVYTPRADFSGDDSFTFKVNDGHLESNIATVSIKVALPAFPGAEGFGACARGGRGGKIVHVTNLNDSGEGSLRWALTKIKGPRIVVFDVGGLIDLKRPITVPARKPKSLDPHDYSDYTIAGQTAPGGITLNNGLSASAHTYWNDNWTRNFIIRHIRVRGYNRGGDSIGLYNATDCILDHVSVSAGCDETIDASGATRYTIQWFTAEESGWGDQGQQSGSGGLNHNFGPFQAYNPKAKSNFHHVLMAHHSSRTPYIHSKSTDVWFDIRNCVVYNGGGTKLQGPFKVNVMNNSYITGPTGPSGLSGPHDTGYYAGNLQYPMKGKPVKLPQKGGKRTEPWPWISVTTETTADALESVLNKAGAWPRDATTRRTVKEVRTRTGKRTCHGPIERLLERRDGPTSEKYDKDRDGMPDAWEKGHGLDPADPEDRNKTVPAGASPDDRHKGYTYVEYYLNELADSIVGKSLGPTHTIKTSVSPPDAGIINAERAPREDTWYNRPYIYGVIEWGEEEYNEGSTAVMRAKAKPGYVFSHWEGEPADGLTARRVAFPVLSDVSVTAHFKPADKHCNISVSVSPAKGGNVAGKGEYREGEIVTLAAYASKGYKFKRWIGGPLDKKANPVIQFAAPGDLDITAEFEPGEGGDFLIDDFNDQNKDSLWKDSSGKPKQWTGRAEFAKISEGDYALTGGYDAFNLGGKGTVTIPEGSTVLKFKVYNLDKEKEANVSNRGEYSLLRRSPYIRWGHVRKKIWKIGMWYSDPLRFPVIPAGESRVMEIPLAFLRNHSGRYAVKPNEKFGRLFIFYYFTGYSKSRSPLWNAEVAVDDVSFGRACAGAITAPNLPPVANAGRHQIARDIDGDGKELVWLNGYDSYDQDAGLIKWIWTENGKELAKGFAPGVELPVGKHTLTLTVTDGPGAVAEDSVSITVLEKE